MMPVNTGSLLGRAGLVGGLGGDDVGGDAHVGAAPAHVADGEVDGVGKGAHAGLDEGGGARAEEGRGDVRDDLVDEVGRDATLDELALTGMTLTAPPPMLERSAGSCAPAASEVAALGVVGASNAMPQLLQCRSCCATPTASIGHYDQGGGASCVVAWPRRPGEHAPGPSGVRLGWA